MLYWVLVLLASFVHLEVAYSVYAVIAMPSFWLSLVLCLVTAMLPVLTSKLLSRMLTPLPSQLIQEIERLPRAVRSALLASGPLGAYTRCLRLFSRSLLTHTARNNRRDVD